MVAFRQRLNAVRKAFKEAGTPWTPVDGPCYTSPKVRQPDSEAQAIYRERVNRARERKGLPPIN